MLSADEGAAEAAAGRARRRAWAVWPAFGVLLLLAAAAGCAEGGARAVAAGAPRSPGGDLLPELMTAVENHTDARGPLFAGDFAAGPAGDAAHLTVVTYNLRYGEAVSAAIDAFRAHEPLAAADIVLLQEMDEAGVETFAREMGYNYVYYPASIARDGDNFGNAILARGPIRDPAKLILPGEHPVTGQQRTATRATVALGGMDVRVYSTHIEVATAPPALRAAQVAAILDDIPPDAAQVIVGGDFNTVTAWGVDALAGQFAAADLGHDTPDLGPTFERFGVRPAATDHLFSRGFERLEAGVLGEVGASDHFPVWATLATR